MGAESSASHQHGRIYGGFLEAWSSEKFPRAQSSKKEADISIMGHHEFIRGIYEARLGQ